jgi:ADP-ribosylglycohydrolase
MQAAIFVYPLYCSGILLYFEKIIMLPLHDRIQGVLFGLAAGDQIGGPIRMALQLAESLIAEKAFQPEDVLARYLRWWQREGFDTGPIADTVFGMIARGMNFQDAARQAHLLANGMSAGCNPAHRSVPLAMAGFLADEKLSELAHQEAALTHFDVVAGDVAATCVCLCRSLIRGVAWEQALLETLPAETRQRLEQAALKTLFRDGFAPHVLDAALYFVHQHADFETALAASSTFAGGANYCPVLVGAIGGARWGRGAIPAAAFQHAQALLPQLQTVSEQLCLTFD